MPERNGDEAMKEQDVQTQEVQAAAGAAEIRTVGAKELLGARGILRIEHEGEQYTLRLTRNNRLILTK
jgi:hemin uptake protein HemP